MLGKKVPAVTFRTRVRDEAVGGPNPFRWQDMTSDDYFKGKKVVLFSLPGAFTPTCSTYQLPDFEKLAGEFRALGVDDIYCLSVNDAFVMDAWAKDQAVGDKVLILADGGAALTKSLDTVLDLTERGLGIRSRRYSMVVDDGVVSHFNLEEGGGFEVSDAETILGQL